MFSHRPVPAAMSWLEELQWKQYEGNDGNLFTRFHVLKGGVLTSLYTLGETIKHCLQPDGSVWEL